MVVPTLDRIMHLRVFGYVRAVSEPLNVLQHEVLSLSLCVSLSVSVSVCLPVCLPVCLSVCLSRGGRHGLSVRP